MKGRRPAQNRGKASRIQDGGSEMDEVELIEISTSSVRTKTLEMEREASCAPNQVAGKRRNAESRNDTDCVVKGK
jgi:hypothetical protein